MVSTSKARQIIYNPNNGTYSPDFSKEPMVLTPELYITGSSTNVIATAETVKWYVRPNTLGQRIPIENNDTYSIGNDFKLTISKNIMKDMLTMEFILEVIYKEPDSDFRTTIPHHMELVNISMGADGRNGVDGLDGLDGEMGLPGPKGKDGESSYTHLAYANDETGAQDFSLSDSNRSYIGMYIDNLENDSTNPSDYKWTKVEGMPGDKGVQGPKGADGRTPYFHIAYATNEDGTKGFSVSDSVGKTYIGQYTDYIENDSTKPSDYSWTKIKGDQGETGPRGLQGLQGAKGDKGLPGPKGANGESSYTHIAYANNDKGTDGFSVSDSYNKLYIGMYVDNLENDSTNPSDYSWTKIKGEDGKDGVAGKDGVGVSNTTITYAQSANGTKAPTTGYTTAVPTLTKGNYLWTKTVWTYTDKTTETGYSVAYVAKDGNDGSDGIAGKDGVGIKTTTITYAKSTSGTVKPTTGYTATIPVVANGQFLWTKTTWTYTDNTTEDGYSVAKMGEKGADGSQGIPGKAGADGRTPYLHIAYLDTTNTMLTDPYFKEGTNGLSTYNNANDGSFSMSRETNVASTSQPRGNDRLKFVHTKAGGSPNRGGFVGIFTGIPSHTYYIEFDAYIPVGASLNPASNSLGAGGGMYWVTSNKGTGRFQTYAYIIKYGTGSVSSSGHMSIAYPNPTFTWWVGYYQRSDITEKFSTTSNTNSNYIGQYTDYTQNDSTNPIDYRWSQMKEEESATLAIITPDGTTVRDTTSSLKLESKLFVGGKETTADSYKWYYPNGSTTTTHSTGKNTSVSATLIKNSLPIFLEATYKGVTYTSSVTINDISDVYTSIILGVSTFKNGKGSNTYTVKLYRNGEEIDPGGSVYSYEWEKLSSQGVKDTKFTKKGKTITITASEIDNTNLFNCYIYTK